MFHVRVLRPAFVMFVAALFMTACSASGPKRMDTATASVDETREKLDSGARQVDVVLASLRNFEGSTDLGSTYKQYSKELEKLEDIAEDVRARRAAMHTRMEDHVEKWKAELANINNPEMREISSQRQADFAKAMQQLSTAMDELKQDYTPFVSNLRDIQLMLANDLSTKGVGMTQPLRSDAVKQGQEVKSSIDKCNQSLASAISQFTR